MRYLSEYIQNPQADRAAMSYQPHSKFESGFTLLEMVLVLFLMGMLASATLFLTENVEDQAKYDETKRRIEIMRQAIIGDSTRKLNGSTEVSGFAADMKRLPGCVKELLEKRNCADTADLPDWKQDSSTGVFYGWRGPYIQVSPESGGELRFRDGYNNTNTSDAENSGWLWQLFDASDASTSDINLARTIKVQSYGSDPSDTSSAYPSTGPLTLVDESLWSIDSITVNLINNASTALPSSASNIFLRVYLNDSSDAVGGYSDSTTAYPLNTYEIAANSTKSITFTFDASSTVPIGNHGFTVFCDTDKKLSSDCSTTLTLPDDVQTFTVAPQQTPRIDWVIQ